MGVRRETFLPGQFLDSPPSRRCSFAAPRADHLPHQRSWAIPSRRSMEITRARAVHTRRPACSRERLRRPIHAHAPKTARPRTRTPSPTPPRASPPPHRVLLPPRTRAPARSGPRRPAWDRDAASRTARGATAATPRRPVAIRTRPASAGACSPGCRCRRAERFRARRCPARTLIVSPSTTDTTQGDKGPGPDGRLSGLPHCLTRDAVAVAVEVVRVRGVRVEPGLRGGLVGEVRAVAVALAGGERRPQPASSHSPRARARGAEPKVRRARRASATWPPRAPTPA